MCTPSLIPYTILTLRHHYQNSIVILLHYFIHIAGDFFRGDGLDALFRLHTDFRRQKLVAGHHGAPVAVGLFVSSNLLHHKLLHLVKFFHGRFLCQFLKLAADDLKRTVFLFRLHLEYGLIDNRHFRQPILRALRIYTVNSSLFLTSLFIRLLSKRRSVSTKTPLRFTPNVEAFEIKRKGVFRAFPEGPPEALLRPYFFVSSFFASSSFFTGAERISR